MMYNAATHSCVPLLLISYSSVRDHRLRALILDVVSCEQCTQASAKTLLTRNALNSVVYPENRYGSLKGRLQAAHFADRRLEDTSRDIVSRLAVEQVETIPEEYLLRITDGRLLCSIMVRTKLRDEFGRILGRIDGEGLRDHQERASKLSNGELLS